MNQKEAEQAAYERAISREPDYYIGKGKRRKPIWVEYVGIKENGDLILGLDKSPEKGRERADKFAAGFGLMRKKECMASTLS